MIHRVVNFLGSTNDEYQFKYVDSLKFRLAQYGTLYNGQIQHDSYECPKILIEVINRVQCLILVEIITPQGFSIWYINFIYIRKIYFLRCI